MVPLYFAKKSIFLMKDVVLPSRWFLSTRLGSLVSEMSCKTCNQGTEDQLHIMWGCNFSKKI